MNPHWLITNILAALMLPPMSLILLACAGWIISRRWLYAGRFLVALSALALVALSTEAGANWLVRPLEQRALPDEKRFKPQAIVVLGGGRTREGIVSDATDQVGPSTLMRLRAGARLHRETRLPLLVTGGASGRPGAPEAELMARSLQQDFGVPVRWIEDQAANTAENAQLSSRLLKSQSIQRVLLVTDAVHMPRAKLAFERTGIQVVPAPSAFVTTGTLRLPDFIPTAQALHRSHYALHEWLGLLWYQMSFGPAI